VAIDCSALTRRLPDSLPAASDRLRLFFACWPAPALQRQLHDVGNILKLQIGGRVSRSENIHLTLAFLGDVAAGQFPVLQQLAGSIVAPAFTLPLERLGCWPDGGIGWLAPDEVPEGLLQLVRQLNEALQRAGFRTEKRRFRPHVTLLRKANKSWRSTLAAPLRWEVDAWVLVASTLDQHGSTYRIVGSWPLH